MQFVSGANSITIQPPRWGYSVELHLALRKEVSDDNVYYWFDRDSTGNMDYRVCNAALWQMPAASMVAMLSFLRDTTKGRGENFTLSLGASHTGFFPFGPDLGDVGDFVVRVLTDSQTGMLEQPWKYFEDSVNLILVTPPAYSAPSIGPDEGPFQIGTVAGLRYPSAGFKPAPKHAWSTALSQTGKPFSLDQGTAGDSWEMSVDIEANQAHAAALVAYLQGATARGQTITLTPGADYYPFGAEQASTGAMSVVLTDNVITIKNDRWDLFTITLLLSKR